MGTWERGRKPKRFERTELFPAVEGYWIRRATEERKRKTLSP